MLNEHDIQRDQIGHFLDNLCNEFYYNNCCSNNWHFWGVPTLKKCHFLSKYCCTYFWATFGKNWATFFLNIWSL